MPFGLSFLNFVKKIARTPILLYCAASLMLVIFLFLSLYRRKILPIFSSISNRLSKRTLAQEKAAQLKQSRSSLMEETPTNAQSNQLPTGSSNPDSAPPCTHCGQPMQKNTATSTPFVTQYICACTGSVHFVNIHKGDRTREGRT